MRIFQRFARGENGQSLVEAALVLPVITVFLLGILQFGLIFHADLMVTHLSREGARAAAVGKTDEEIVGSISALASSLRMENLNIDIVPLEGNRFRGVPVTVRIDYELPLLVPFFNAFLQDPFPLHAETTMRME